MPRPGGSETQPTRDVLIILSAMLMMLSLCCFGLKWVAEGQADLEGRESEGVVDNIRESRDI